jgi:hypothetical protein
MPATVLLKGTTKAINLLETVTGNMNWVGLNLTNLSGVTIGGVSAVVERREALVELMDEEAIKIRNNSVMQHHCLIHQVNLCAISLEAENVKQFL